MTMLDTLTTLHDELDVVPGDCPVCGDRGPVYGDAADAVVCARCWSDRDVEERARELFAVSVYTEEMLRQLVEAYHNRTEPVDAPAVRDQTLGAFEAVLPEDEPRVRRGNTVPLADLLVRERGSPPDMHFSTAIGNWEVHDDVYTVLVPFRLSATPSIYGGLFVATTDLDDLPSVAADLTAEAHAAAVDAYL